MTPPPGSLNLRNFRKAFNDFRFYYLFPAHVGSSQILDMDLSLYIEKREIHFVHTSEIKSQDPEYAVFAKDGSSNPTPPDR